MPIRSVDDIRNAWGEQWASASDEELLDAYSRAAKLPLGQVADKLNWGGEGRGMWGNRGSAAVDSYQANLYGVGEALGSDWAKRKRIENEVQANVARDWAQQQGAISSYKDVGGFGDFGNYAGGLAIDSAPYLGEAVLGGGVGGLAARGLGLAGRAAARTSGAVGASYPSAVGDILSNQREQAGTTDLGAAMLGAVPYAAANAFGVEGALARGVAAKSGIRALDELTGLRGVAARTGASMGRGVLQEAPSEVFQEGVNQYFGRMAVDPNETFFNERSNDRFMESAVGGGVLGGLFGGGMGGWRRSNEWYEKQAEEARRAASAPQGQSDLLQGDTPEVPKVGDQGALFGYGASPNQYDETGRSDPLPAVEELFAAKRGIAAKAAELQRRYDVAEDAFKSTGDYDTWNAQRSQLIGMLAQLSPQADVVEAQIERYTNANRMEMANYGLPTAGQGRLNFDPGVGTSESLYDYGLPSTVDLAGVINPFDVGGFVSRTDTGESIDPTTPQYGLFGGGGDQTLGENLGAPLSFTAPTAPATTAETWANQGESDKLGLPKQPTKAARGVFDQAVDARKNGDLDDSGYFAVAADLKGGNTNKAKTTLKAETNRVAGMKALQAAPPQPTTPNVVINAAGPATQGGAVQSVASGVKPSVPAAPIAEPTNQLLQGAPDGSVAAMAGQRPGGSRVGGSADAGAGVADAGRDVDTAVGVPAPADGVGAVAGQAGTVPDAAASGANDSVGDTLKKTGKLLDKIKGKTAVIGGSIDFAALKDALEVHEPRMHHAVRLYLGVDKDGYRLDAPLSAQAAAEKAGIAKPGKKNSEVSRVANALGLTTAVRNRWTTSNATVNERAEGDVEGPVAEAASSPSAEDNTPSTSDEAFGGNESGDKDPTFADAGYGVVSDVGGSQSRIEPSATGLVGQGWYKSAVVDGLTSLRDSELAALAAKSMPYANDPGSRAALNGLMDEVKSRSRKPGFTTLMTLAYNEEYPDGTNAKKSKSDDAIAAEERAREDDSTGNDAGPDGLDSVYGDSGERERAGTEGNAAGATEGSGEARTAAPSVTVKKRRKFGKDTGKAKDTHNSDGTAKDPYTAADLTKELAGFMRVGALGRNVVVVDSVEDLLNSTDPVAKQVGQSIQDAKAYGVAAEGKAYLIANRITKGMGRAKFMHEVGSHLGLDRMLPKATFDRLVNQIREWARNDNGSPEFDLAWRATQRVFEAGTEAGDRRSELVAYFVELAVEDGIDPTAAAKLDGPLGQWFRTLWAAFKDAMRKLRGVNIDKLNAQDVVNLAYGSARLEIAGTWHGTAASFRRFNHAYMGSGEGAQAYGWGSYLAQSVGIAKGYWTADVKRKTGSVANYLTNPKVRKSLESLGQRAKDDADKLATWLKTNNPHKARPAVFGVMADFKYSMNYHSEFIQAVAARAKDLSEGETVTPEDVVAAVDMVLAQSEQEGSLMRVDTAVDQRDMLDWDRPLRSQASVMGKITESLPDGLREAVEEEANESIDEMTGQTFYEALQFLEGREGTVSELFDTDYYNKELANAKPKKVVSYYLDQQLGIQGLKFLDQPSRGQPKKLVFAGKSYARDDLVKLKNDTSGLGPYSATLRHVLRDGLAPVMADFSEKVAKTEAMFLDISKTSAERFKLAFDEKASRERASRDAAETYEGKQLAWLEANKDSISVADVAVTRNLVIFNDKNIFRVGSQVGADRQRMKFGKNAAPSANAQTQSVATAEKAIRAYPAALRPAARAVHRVLGKYARGALNTVMFTEDLMNRAIGLGMKSAKAYKDLANQKESFTGSYERRVLNTVSGYTDLPEKIKGKGPGTVNAFLQDSQMQSEFAGKWGYQPSWLDKVEIDPKAKAAYEALGDKGMAYADSVFKLGHDTLALKKQTVIESTTSEYDVLIAAATKDGNTQEAEELTAEKVKTLEQFGTMMKLGGKFPYSPVKRFGNYVVVAESQKYMDAKKAGDTKLMRQLEGDPNEYFVDFAESDGDAQKIEDELRATGLYVDPGYRPRETMRDDLYGGSNTLKALSKLRERAAAMPEATSQDKQTKEAATKLRTLLTDLYLMQLAEGSSRKSEMKRRGVAGNIDMIRSLETQGKADAHFLGSVKFGGKMLESIGEMRKEMRDGSSDQRLRRSEVLNEVIARHMQSMDYKETPLVDALRMVPSVFFLAMSPSYYIQNALQPFMLSLPLMAAKHGYGKTSKALVDAYTSVAPAFKNADVFKQIDFDALLASGNNALTKDEKVMVQSLLDSGRLDIGMATEFGSLRADGDGKVSAAWNKARNGLTGLQSKMEALNRLSTALAAFRLESGSGAVKATEYADRVIQETHGDYNAQNAPRAFNTAWGKVGLQFKKYQLIQLTLMAKLLKNSFGEAKTKEEKDARTLARKALTYTMGQAAVIGGGKALPIPFVVAWLFGAAFGDDSDEPPEYVLRQMIGNKDIADLLISGPLSFAGINGSGLGGFGNAVAALPFVDVDLTSREGVMETAFAIGAGPLGGLSLKTADAVGAMTNGDYFKGLGMLLPKGPGSLIKAGEQMANGIYQRDGDTTMSADEITGWASLQQGLGFTPQQTLERQYRQQSAYKIDASMRDQNAEIKRMYSRALKNGESTAEAKEAWIKYQAKRVNMGYERQPMSELTKSAKTQSEREKETVGGVQYRKSNREFVENLGRI